MDFRILGPLEVRNASGVVELGGSKPRAVMAMLLLHPNEPVTAARLALAVWGEDAPSTAVRTVQVYVSRLRRALGEPEALVRTARGYRLRVLPGELDVERFAALLGEGRRALSDGQPDRAAVVLREAQALWRGPPLAEFEFESFARAEITRLEEQRLAGLVARVDADLAGGQHTDLVTELRRLVAENPAHEPLVGQLMLALYRCGQQADALDAYRAARAELVAELGIEPGPQLRDMEAAILRQDAALDWPPSSDELPPPLDASAAPTLIGRDGELAWLRAHREQASRGRGALVAVAGVAGIGKTRLAGELAGEVKRHGATVLFADGAGPGAAVLAALARARTATRETLLVIDDADRAGADVLAVVAELAEALAGRPVLAVAIGGEAETLRRHGARDVLRLGPLDRDAVHAIAVARRPDRGDADVPTAWLLQASGGVPRRIHEAVAHWVGREAAQRVEAVAGRAAARRAELRLIEDELATDVIELQAAREPIGPAAGEGPAVCPFKGLASFETSDASYFFGRERLVAELVARLVGAPLLAIVGPSGSGKSSVLQAGLLPALAGGVLPGSEGWPQTLIRPGEQPLRELELAMARLGDGNRRVLAVDQFEETFTACRDEAQRSAFIAALASIAGAGDGDGRCVVVLAIRADYYGRCAAYPALSKLLAPNHVLVGPMRRDELRRAVECPARRAGLHVEPELTDALLADVEREIGGLPLLSAALLELWQRRDGGPLRHGAYLQSGGVRGAVARLAESAFGELDAARQETARMVLMRLVAEGTDGAIERRRVPLTELGAEHGDDVALIVGSLADRRLLTIDTGTVEFAHEALSREWPRLREWIETDRESLQIRRSLSAAALEWRRLGHDREALYRGARLARTIEWRDARLPPLNALEREFLDAGESASRHERRTQRRRVGVVLAAVTTGLVAAVLAAVFAAGQRDVARSRDLASKASALDATDPPLALTLALNARARSDTEQAGDALRQATLADRATRVVPTGQGLVFGVATSPDGRFAATAGGNGSLDIWRLATGRRIGAVRGYHGEVRAVSYSDDGRLVATAAHDGAIAVAPAMGGTRRVLTRLKGGEFAESIDVGPGATTIAIGTNDGRVAVVSVSDGSVHTIQPAGPDGQRAVYVVGYDRHARRIVSAGSDGVARIWRVAGGAPLELHHPKNRIGAIQQIVGATFSPGDGQVATADEYGSVLLWNARTGRLVRRIVVSDQQQASVQFSADGRRIVTAGVDGVVHVSELRPDSVVATLRGHHGQVRAAFVPGGHGTIVSAGEEDGTLRTWLASPARVASQPGSDPTFDATGRSVLSIDRDGAVRVWEPAGGRERSLPGADASVARFSPDGAQVVSGSFHGGVRLWNLRTGRTSSVQALAGAKYAVALAPGSGRIAIGGDSPLVVQAPDGTHRVRLQGHIGRVNALAFSPDGRYVLSGSDDGIARIWDAAGGRLVRALNGHQGVVRGVAYSKDARRIATAGSDGTVAIWSVRGGDPVILAGHEGAVNTVRFDDDGSRVVTAGDDGTIRVWDPAGGDALVVLDQYAGIATGADFGRDGRDVVSAGDDGMRLSPCEVCGTLADIARLARSRAHHTLTALERRRLLPGG